MMLRQVHGFVSNTVWIVGPVDYEWTAIIHEETRGRAKARGASIGFDDFVDMRARRLPKFDGKLITREMLIEHGFVMDGFSFPYEDGTGYLADCGCSICWNSMKLLREGVRRAKEVQN